MSQLMYNLSLCLLGFIASTIIYLVVKWGHKKHIEDSLMESSVSSYTDQLNKHKTIFVNIKIVDIIFWVVLTTILAIFDSNDDYKQQADVAEITIEDMNEIQPAKTEEIEEANKKSLNEKEVKREKEIKKEREKSRDDFSDFLKNVN